MGQSHPGWVLELMALLKAIVQWGSPMAGTWELLQAMGCGAGLCETVERCQPCSSPVCAPRGLCGPRRLRQPERQRGCGLSGLRGTGLQLRLELHRLCPTAELPIRAQQLLPGTAQHRHQPRFLLLARFVLQWMGFPGQLHAWHTPGILEGTHALKTAIF